MMVYQEMIINIESVITSALPLNPLGLMGNFGPPNKNLALTYFNHVDHFP